MVSLNMESICQISLLQYNVGYLKEYDMGNWRPHSFVSSFAMPGGLGHEEQLENMSSVYSQGLVLCLDVPKPCHGWVLDGSK
ncbi:hypothetical protein SCA6_015007 [Theobroma cacao]